MTVRKNYPRIIIKQETCSTRSHWIYLQFEKTAADDMVVFFCCFFFCTFQRKQDMAFYVNCLLAKQFTRNAKSC